jgi:hypothetical protein
MQERTLAAVTIEKRAEVAAEFDAVHTVQRARDVGSLHSIIAPAQLRPYLIGLLDGTGMPPDGNGGGAALR